MALEDVRSDYIRMTTRGDVAVCCFTPRQLTDEQNMAQLGKDLFSVMEEHGARKIVLDMSNVDYVTSSILGKFITLHRKLHRDGGKLVVCCCGPEVGKILEMSGLNVYFNMAANVDAAVGMLTC